MSGWSWILFWWVAFAGGHLTLSAMPVRRRLVARLGERGFQALYSALALTTLIGLVVAYAGNRHAGPRLWDLGSVPAARALAIALATAAVVVLVPGITRRDPAGEDAGGPRRGRGLTRIVRHPFFMALGLWGLAHALVSGDLGDVVFFGSFPVFGIVGGLHQDARRRASREDLRDFYRETSFIPFGAIVAGRNRLVLREFSLARAAIGVGLATAVYLLHRPLLRG